MKAKQLIFLPLVALLLSGCNPAGNNNSNNQNEGENNNNQPEHLADYSDTFVDERTGVIEDNNGYYKECSFADSLSVAEYSFWDERSHFWPVFREVVGDSVYIRTYKMDHSFFMNNFYDYKDTVVSRYTERCGGIRYCY